MKRLNKFIVEKLSEEEFSKVFIDYNEKDEDIFWKWIGLAVDNKKTKDVYVAMDSAIKYITTIKTKPINFDKVLDVWYKKLN